MPITLSFVEPVSYYSTSIEASGPRLFSVNINVYNKNIGAETIYKTFILLCFFPSSPQWRTVKLPFLYWYVFITANIVGFYLVNGHCSLYILIINLTYLPGTTLLTSFLPTLDILDTTRLLPLSIPSYKRL